MPELVLNKDETIIRKTGGMEYVGIGRISAWLTLTSHRLIVQRILNSPFSYPLSRISKVSEYEYWPAPFSIIPLKLLRVDFDNGGSLFFGLSGLSNWIQMIETTRVNAPQLPYSIMPAAPESLRSFSSSAPKTRWVILAMVAISFIVFCSCTPIIFWLLLNLKTR